MRLSQNQVKTVKISEQERSIRPTAWHWFLATASWMFFFWHLDKTVCKFFSIFVLKKRPEAVSAANDEECTNLEVTNHCQPLLVVLLAFFRIARAVSPSYHQAIHIFTSTCRFGFVLSSGANMWEFGPLRVLDPRHLLLHVNVRLSQEHFESLLWSVDAWKNKAVNSEPKIPISASKYGFNVRHMFMRLRNKLHQTKTHRLCQQLHVLVTKKLTCQPIAVQKRPLCDLFETQQVTWSFNGTIDFGARSDVDTFAGPKIAYSCYLLALKQETDSKLSFGGPGRGPKAQESRRRRRLGVKIRVFDREKRYFCGPSAIKFKIYFYIQQL